VAHPSVDIDDDVPLKSFSLVYFVIQEQYKKYVANGVKFEEVRAKTKVHHKELNFRKCEFTCVAKQKEYIHEDEMTILIYLVRLQDYSN